MRVIRQQSLHRGIFQVAFHSGSYRGDGPLVQGLVALDINTPIPGALVERNISMVRKEETSFTLGVIPVGLDDPYFRVVDSPDGVKRAISRARYVDDHLIAQRKQRADGGHKWVTQIHAIPNKGESADFHGPGSLGGLA